MTWIVKVLSMYIILPILLFVSFFNILVTNVNLSTLESMHECIVTKQSYHCICSVELHFCLFLMVLVYFNWFLVCFNCLFFVCFSLLLFRSGWFWNTAIYRTIDPAWSSFAQHFSISAFYNHLTTFQVNKKHRIFWFSPFLRLSQWNQISFHVLYFSI